MGIEEGASARDDDESTFTICDQMQKFCLGFIFCDALSNVHILLLIPKPAGKQKMCEEFNPDAVAIVW